MEGGGAQIQNYKRKCAEPADSLRFAILHGNPSPENTNNFGKYERTRANAGKPQHQGGDYAIGELRLRIPIRQPLNFKL